MGGCFSSSAPRFKTIDDKYESLEQVQAALRANGLESSRLIVGIDFTASNLSSGAVSFGGRSLHDTTVENPYEQALLAICNTLSAFDDSGEIFCYGFGDTRSRDSSVFSLFPDGKAATDLSQLFWQYKYQLPHIKLSGPTSFAPLIHQAIERVIATGNRYHILVILADGLVSEECRKATEEALVRASSYPLSIVCIGLGDGPFDAMQEFDDKLPKRNFDNFQFLNMTALSRITFPDARTQQAYFAMSALQEVPVQYQIIKKLGLLAGQTPHGAAKLERQQTTHSKRHIVHALPPPVLSAPAGPPSFTQPSVPQMPPMPMPPTQSLGTGTGYRPPY